MMFTSQKKASKVAVPHGRVFSPAEAKGGLDVVDASKTAVLFIEYQNEFAMEGGKLHDGVKGVMASTGMLNNSVRAAKAVREAGGKVMHIAITFDDDASDNPNKGLGILKGCADGKLFVRGTWGAAFCDQMAPLPGDIVIEGKRGLDSFPGTTLEAELKAQNIETLAIAGFLTNCCVESTMRTAFEKGFNTITLTDCCATTSEEGQAAATGGTFGMFSSPMTGADFAAKLGQSSPSLKTDEAPVKAASRSVIGKITFGMLGNSKAAKAA